MINELTKETKNRMTKSVESLKTDLSKIRTGRASTGLVEHIMVDYYGNPTSLSQVANISVENARTLAVSPWEETMIPAVEKAIRNAEMGLNPSTAGKVIRVPVPSLNEERRKELIKLIRDECEKSKVAVRNIRRDANTSIKDLLKDKKISEDDERRAELQIQKLTDEMIAGIDKLLQAKESDIMEI